MTTMDRLIKAAEAASDLFRDGDTPDQHEIRELVRAVDGYRDMVRRAYAAPMPEQMEHDHQDGCLMCAVRALTEGDPLVTWAPTEAGATISGVVLRQGEVSTNFGLVPFVDLWQGGTGRVRVMAYAASLRHVLAQSAAQIGDRLQVWYDGTRDLPARGTRPATAYKIFSANVQRGH